MERGKLKESKNKNVRNNSTQDNGKINAWDRKTGILLIKNGKPTKYYIHNRIKKTNNKKCRK